MVTKQLYITISTRVLTTCAFALLGSSVGFAQPDKVIYELRERCGRQAAETVKKEWSGNVVNTKNGQALAGFENHYNSRLNKRCEVAFEWIAKVSVE